MKTLKQHIIITFGKHKVKLYEGNITKFTTEAVKEWLQEHKHNILLYDKTTIEILIKETEQ